MQTGLAAELMALARSAAETIALPPIRQIYLPPTPVPDHMDGEFGFVILAGGATGNFFTLLDDTLVELHEMNMGARWHNQPVLELAALSLSENPVERTLGFGALNAITQQLFANANYIPQREINAMDWLAAQAGERLGMVGYITPWVRRLVARGVDVVVVEKNPALLERDDGAMVTLDSSVLGGCDKVLITASTLLNDTLDQVLSQCATTAKIALVGPTASGFPEPFFKRGIGLLGGNRVLDAGALLQRVASGERWGDAAEKYCIDQADYPGSDVLLSRCVEVGK